MAELAGQRLLKFMTCGSVDDGKSTLIGQLLLKTDGLFEDQFGDLADDNGQLALNQVVDGLLSEREQGITIDVAHRYFSTSKRKFIIFDTPGHEQYTRNMATAASQVDLAVVLVDAEKGVRDQTKRHCFIAALFGVKHLVILVNKMDAVQYNQHIFDDIKAELGQFLQRLELSDVDFIPVSATKGINIDKRSDVMSWYSGRPLLDFLEELYTESDLNFIDLRFAVQHVAFVEGKRYLHGKVLSGILRKGQAVKVFPGGFTANVSDIKLGEDEFQEVKAGRSITLEIDRELDVARGSLLSNVHNKLEAVNKLDVKMVWMNAKKLVVGHKLIINHRGQLVNATVEKVFYRINLDDLRKVESDTLQLNDIGRISLKLQSPVFAEKFQSNRLLGSIVAIDYENYFTVGAGVVNNTSTAAKSSSTLRPEFVEANSKEEACEISNLLKEKESEQVVFNLYQFSENSDDQLKVLTGILTSLSTSSAKLIFVAPSKLRAFFEQLASEIRE